MKTHRDPKNYLQYGQKSKNCWWGGAEGGGGYPFKKIAWGGGEYFKSPPPPHELGQIAMGCKRKKNFGLGKKSQEFSKVLIYEPFFPITINK